MFFVSICLFIRFNFVLNCYLLRLHLSRGRLVGALVWFAPSVTIHCRPLPVLPSFFSMLLLSCESNLRHLYNRKCCKCHKTSTKQTNRLHPETPDWAVGGRFGVVGFASFIALSFATLLSVGGWWVFWCGLLLLSLFTVILCYPPSVLHVYLVTLIFVMLYELKVLKVP